MQMEIDLGNILAIGINISLLIVGLTLLFSFLKKFIILVNRNKEIEKKVDLILRKLDDKNNY